MATIAETASSRGPTLFHCFLIYLLFLAILRLGLFEFKITATFACFFLNCSPGSISLISYWYWRHFLIRLSFLVDFFIAVHLC